MPDEYGRPTGDDFVKVARGLREYNEGVKKEDEERGFGLGLEELDAASREGRAAVRPAGTSITGWVKSQDAHGKGQAGLLLADQSRQALEESKLSNEYMALAGKAKTPEERISVLKQQKPQTIVGARALASVQRHVIGDNETGVALVGSLYKRGLAEYNTVFAPALNAAERLLKEGKTEAAAATLEQASQVLPIRGEWRAEEGEDGALWLRRYHNRREDGFTSKGESDGAEANRNFSNGYTPTDEAYPVGVAVEKIKEYGDVKFAKEIAAHIATGMEYNSKAFTEHVYNAKGQDGEKLLVVPQINLKNGVREHLVYDGDNGKLLSKYSNDELQNSGLRIVTKEQRALDNDERKVDLEAAKLGMQREALGLRAEGGGGGQTLAEKYVGLVSKHEAALAQEDPFSEPEARRNIARARALEDVRVLTGDEGIQTEADVSARSRVRGVKPGAAPAQSRSVAPTVSAPPAAAFEGLKPGQTRSFKNTETGEVQAWTVDPVSKQPVRVKNSVKKGG